MGFFFPAARSSWKGDFFSPVKQWVYHIKQMANQNYMDKPIEMIKRCLPSHDLEMRSIVIVY